MSLLKVTLAVVLSGVVCDAAFAQGNSNVNCVAYAGLNSGEFVRGAIIRTSNRNVWLETNNGNPAPISWRETDETGDQVTLFDASRSYTLVINAGTHQITVRRGPTDTFHPLYSIAFVE
jgi:hypothetical protein